MTVSSTSSQLLDLRAGEHASWVVSEDDHYDEVARRLVATGIASNEKTFGFGPAGRPALAALEAAGARILDPRVAVLASGPLVPDAMFTMFREQTTMAREEGFDRLRVIADMDWLLPTGASGDEVLGFEVRLDEAIRDLGATVVCAYHASSFERAVLEGIACVHPAHVGPALRQMTVLNAGPGIWRVEGEIDLGVEGTFAAVLGTIAEVRGTLDLGALRFIDVLGMRMLARHLSEGSLTVTSCPAWLERLWRLGRFDDIAPLP